MTPRDIATARTKSTWSAPCCTTSATPWAATTADIAASILKPFVSDENHWMVAHHGIFQGDYFFHHLGMDRDLREQLRGQPELFQRTAHFCCGA